MLSSSSRSSALEWLLVDKLGQPPDLGRGVSLALQVAVALMMLTALAVFIDWKMDFDALGCKSYCNCTARLVEGGRQYSIEPDGSWVPLGEEPGGYDVLVERLESCEGKLSRCESALVEAMK
jgi:hypothetical protein